VTDTKEAAGYRGDILEARGITKRYPGVLALDAVDFDLRRGEVQALVGQNGAGKSTFVEIVAGSLRPDSGVIELDGRSFASLDPSRSIELGIQTVHQENQLVDELTVAENIYLYALPRSGAGLLDYGGCFSRAQELLAERGVSADVWSATSYSRLRMQALDVEHRNTLHPHEAPEEPEVTRLLRDAAAAGPIVAASDWIRAVPDQVARWVPGTWVSLGTDGFGRSDSREALRRFFEVDAEHVAAATLSTLARRGDLDGPATMQEICDLGVDPAAPFSLTA